jgi:lysozyme family protein
VTPAEQAIEFVLRHEGGYAWHESDPGGETHFGISKRSYPDEDIKTLTRERAATLYHRDYWQPIRGDALPETLAVPLMDYAVNSGISRSCKAIQEIVGMNPTGRIEDVDVEAIRAACARTGPVAIAEDLILERAMFLVRLGCTRKGSEAFLVGWMKRIRDNLRYVRSG